MPAKDFTDAEIAKVRRLHDAGVLEPADLAKLLGVTLPTFRRYRAKWGWSAPRPPAEPTPAEPATETIALDVERMVEREIARLGAARAITGIDAERRARTLASLIRSLALLRRMDGAQRDKLDDDREPDAVPRDLAALRAELARRLDRLREDGPA